MPLYLFLLLLFFSFPIDSQEEPHFKRSIGLIVDKNFRGEYEFAERVKIACEKLQWEAYISDVNFFKDTTAHYDWIFTLVHKKKCHLKSDNYLILFDPEHHFFNQDGRLKKSYLDYTGYLTIYENIDLLLKDKKIVYDKKWYPTVQYQAYQKVTPTCLFYFIGHWGDRLLNDKYKILQHKLAEMSYAHLFGNPEVGDAYGKAFKGSLPYDGTSVIKKISEMGVCLVLHSKTHLKHEIPSGRIFEAAAASAVIISDLNPFVMKHFGDAVLYVNEELSGEEVFEQIDSHMRWIQKKPDEALKMAYRAHQIFEDCFTLEQQLLDFNDFRDAMKLVNGN
jgi:hypothetical protein